VYGKMIKISLSIAFVVITYCSECVLSEYILETSCVWCFKQTYTVLLFLLPHVPKNTRGLEL